MYRDGQVLFKTNDKEWIIRGAKMSSTQFKRQIEQQILDMERRKQENQKG
jgi:predicted enzyme involved in methoxymalonyl-ACP biosynthesis